MEKKKAKEEVAKEKAQLKREEHKILLDLPAATAVRAEETAATIEVHPEPSRIGQSEDLLETLLVEPGPLLISLNPFEGEDEPRIRTTSGARPAI